MSPADQDVREPEAREDPHADAAQDDDDGHETHDKKPRSRLPLIIAGVVTVVAIIAAIIYWLATAGELSTDDAYTDGSSVSIASNVSGYVTALYINDNTFVHTGDLLLTVDPRQNTASLQQAQAQVATASLVPQMIESAQQDVVQRAAQVAQAQANLAQARVMLTYNEIRAPQDGWITMRNADLGTYVQAGQQIFYIVSPNFWVTANLKETQLQHIRPGDHVRMTVDAYPGVVLFGHVGSIQAGSGAQFSAFPAENATGNYVKIVRRVPVKILIDGTKPRGVTGLPLGISVEPTVTIK